jgi:hypothetical protein
MERRENRNNHNNIYKLVAYFYYVLKILGMAPYTIDWKFHVIKTTFWDLARLFGALIFWSYIIIVHTRTYDLPRYRSGINFKIVDTLWQNNYAYQNFTIFIIIIFNYLKRKNVKKFLKLICIYDRHIKKLGWQPAESTSVFSYIIPTAALILTILSIRSISIAWRGIDTWEKFNGYIKTISFAQILAIYFMIEMVFIGSCCCISSRLTVLTINMR